MVNISNFLLDSLVNEILKKKEFKAVDAELIKKNIFLKLKDQKLENKLQEKAENRNLKQIKKGKEFQQIVKQVRKELREIYGIFLLADYEKKASLLIEFKKTRDEEILKKILALHKSSKERLPQYDKIYSHIFNECIENLNDKIISVIDLGCGLNPLSVIFIQKIIKNEISYSALDISSKELKFIKDFFSALKINCSCDSVDLTEEREFKKIGFKTGAINILFLFKLVDSLELIKRHSSKQLINYLFNNIKKDDLIIISFSRINIKGDKEILEKKRSWFEKFLKKSKIDFEKFVQENELFYIIKKE